jgi:hypothetical protein
VLENEVTDVIVSQATVIDEPMSFDVAMSRDNHTRNPDA